MSRSRLRAAASLLVFGALAGLMTPRPAHAYRCTRVAPEVGPSLVWGGRIVPWWLDAQIAALSGATGREQAEASFAAWSDPNCSDLEFPLEGVRAGLVSAYVPGEINRNVVVLMSEWPGAPGTIALTVSAFDTATGIILDSDIELNGEQFTFDLVDPLSCASVDARMDLRNTLTHEVGHLLGLDHPPASERFSDATMFASAPPCETSKRSLAADDVEGLCAIYPAEAPTRPCFPPDQPGFMVVDSDDGYGCRAGARSDGSPSVFVLGWAFVLWRGRRRPRR